MDEFGVYGSFGQGKPYAEEDPKGGTDSNKNGSIVLYGKVGILVTHRN